MLCTTPRLTSGVGRRPPVLARHLRLNLSDVVQWSRRPALEVEGVYFEMKRLPQSPNPVSTLRRQSTGIRALSSETSQASDVEEILGL